jgi:molybdate transport system substrate-binding protein
MRKFSLLLVGMGLAFFGASAADSTPAPSQVTIAAAADLRYALNDIIKAFSDVHPGVLFKVAYGSSGNFLTQLQQRAPFDMFLSADEAYPAQLIKAGLAPQSSLFSYARGSIVVWVPNSSSLDPATLGIKTLLDPSIKKVAIANPLHAPYGRAAEAAMKSLGVTDQVASKLVLGENIAQTAQFVQSGAAQAGIIALSLAEAPPMKDKGKFWMVPQDSYPPLNQAGVILNWAKNPDAAQAFRDFLLSDAAGKILTSYGFELPQH